MGWDGTKDRVPTTSHHTLGTPDGSLGQVGVGVGSNTNLHPATISPQTRADKPTDSYDYRDCRASELVRDCDKLLELGKSWAGAAYNNGSSRRGAEGPRCLISAEFDSLHAGPPAR